MARRKLTDEEKQKRAEVRALNLKSKEEKTKKERDLSDIKRMREQYINSPTIFYSVGERVIWGRHPNAEVVEIFDNGKFYKVRAWGEYKEYGRPVQRESTSFLQWADIQKYRTEEENNQIEIFAEKDELRLNYSQTGIMDIFGKVYYFGLDMAPEYQRGNVWDLGDKQKLIQSIFNNVDIGKFVFINLPIKINSPAYEVLDGKQRINAIIEFYENRFKFNDKTFSELNWEDQWHFENYSINIATVSNVTRRQKLLYFLKLNTGGRLVNPEHIKYVQKLYDEEVKNENYSYPEKVFSCDLGE